MHSNINILGKYLSSNWKQTTRVLYTQTYATKCAQCTSHCTSPFPALPLSLFQIYLNLICSLLKANNFNILHTHTHKIWQLGWDAEHHRCWFCVKMYDLKALRVPKLVSARKKANSVQCAEEKCWGEKKSFYCHFLSSWQAMCVILHRLSM